jgi:hypothetical protein
MGVTYDRDSGEKYMECDDKTCQREIRGNNVALHAGNVYHAECAPGG